MVPESRALGAAEPLRLERKIESPVLSGAIVPKSQQLLDPCRACSSAGECITQVCKHLKVSHHSMTLL